VNHIPSSQPYCVEFERQFTALYKLKLRHPRCVCNNEVKDRIGQNTTGLLVGGSYGVNETARFGLLGGHHHVYKY